MRHTPEQLLLKLIAARDSEIAKSMNVIGKKYDKRITRFRSTIKAKGCAHPVEAVVEFRWEWDDGYGTQKKLPGLRCSVCKAQQLWPGSSNWIEERERSDD